MKKSKNKYYIEPHVRKLVDSIIQNYPYKKAEYESLVGIKGNNIDGLPHGTGISDSVANQVQELVNKYDKFIEPVDKALKEIPKEYGPHIVNKIAYGIQEPDYASSITWKRYRRKFRYLVAVYAEII